MYVVNIGSRLNNQSDISPVHFLSYVTLQIINNINRNVFAQGKNRKYWQLLEVAWGPGSLPPLVIILFPGSLTSAALSVHKITAQNIVHWRIRYREYLNILTLSIHRWSARQVEGLSACPHEMDIIKKKWERHTMTQEAHFR